MKTEQRRFRLADGEEIPYRGPLITFEARPGVYRIERRVLWQERWGGGGYQ